MNNNFNLSPVLPKFLDSNTFISLIVQNFELDVIYSCSIEIEHGDTTKKIEYFNISLPKMTYEHAISKLHLDIILSIEKYISTNNADKIDAILLHFNIEEESILDTEEISDLDTEEIVTIRNKHVTSYLPLLNDMEEFATKITRDEHNYYLESICNIALEINNNLSFKDMHLYKDRYLILTIFDHKEVILSKKSKTEYIVRSIRQLYDIKSHIYIGTFKDTLHENNSDYKNNSFFKREYDNMTFDVEGFEINFYIDV